MCREIVRRGQDSRFGRSAISGGIETQEHVQRREDERSLSYEETEVRECLERDGIEERERQHHHEPRHDEAHARHEGAHPRVGAVDVCPIVPIRPRRLARRV